MNFGTALNLIMKYSHVEMSLPQWDNDVFIRVQRTTNKSKMTHPYLYVESKKGLVPWIPNMVEILSDEWEVSEEFVSTK